MTTVFLCHLLCLLTCCSAYENLALYKPAHQDKPYLQGNFSAEWAVDGRKSDLRGLAGQCSLSANNQYTITWWVNLTSICSIHDIRIYYRTENVAWENNGNEARFLGFSIYVSNTTNKSEGTLCYRDTNFTTSTIPAVFNTSCFVHGQYVIYYNERLPEKTYPSDYSDYAFGDLCEVEVYGCSTPGVFGINCTTPCPNTNCQYCHIETGSCQGCKTGYVGHQCVEECDNGRYGDGCQRQCGYCINRTQCHHVNGTCLKGCDAGYHGQMCNQKCGVGFYGQGCTIPCGKCFNQSNCSPINGTCPNGCLPGYKGDECHEQCTESFFGANCKEKCNATCLGCNRFTGICDKGCQPGWNGNDCQYECDNKTYGENCSKSCGNCKNNQQCDHINGTCTNGCENGYQVPKCDRECDNGTYGNGCDKTCGRCVNNTLCYHVNGTCFAGCDPGYMGSRCHQECNENKYGDGCKSICGHCFNMTQCNVENGTCLDGCDPGYEGQKCDRECQNRTYGNSCQRKCGHCLNGAQCDHTNGTCLQGCEPGYGGRTCHLVNLALHKPANEENIYNHENVTAGKAVDGRKSNLHGTGGECSTSATDQRTATWWVNLEAIYSIHDIRIYYRTDNVPWGTSNEFTARFLGFSLYVSNTTDKSDGKICFKDSNFTRSTIPAVLDITCFVHGQYVIYYNERLDGKIYPDYYSNFSFNDLCEVEVYGCPRPSYYGIDCNTPCPDTNCRYCHIETGTCQGCKPGYVGHQCNFECENGWYGEGCQSKCGQCLNVTQCYHVNGTCFQGCAAGYEGQLCDQECKYGFFGENCVRECPAYCYSCNKSSGICDLGCHPGWKGKFCTEECDGNSYGENCSKSCGNCKNNQQCNHIDGACLNGCAIGYKDSKCDKECEEYMYGENCSFSCGNCEDNEKCNHIDGTCMGGCEKGYQGPRCDTECDSYRFGKNCSRQCGHCFNNSTCQHVNGTCIDGCDRGYQGTECMQKCFNNTYGHNCQENCGRYCITCDIVTGVCDSGCFPGWKGDHCQKKCGDLFYGLNCSIPCGNCLNNEQCQNVYGYCENGCASGFHGNNCITECIDGYFGINCLEKCNETCNSCNKTSGVCEYGCQSGWKGDFCETECDGGLFGVNCSIECGHCLNDQQCHHINGICLNGCDPGYTEDNCTKACPAGTFSLNCNKTCSINCRHPDHCEPETGHCIGGCVKGWKGAQCKTECDNNMFGENCTEMCGNCINSTQCHHINGSCPLGCEEGFQGPLCNKECIDGRFGYDCQQNCSFLCVNGTCDKKNGSCEKIALRTDDKIDSDNSRFIGIGVGLTIIQIAWISILVFVCRRRHRTSEPSARTVNSHQRDEMKLTGQGKNSTMSASGSRNGRPAVETTPLDEGVNGILAEDPEYFNVTRTATPDIAIDKLKAVIAENGKNENEGFRKEYSALPNGELHKCDIGRKPENVPKNRYKTTFPYDHSRVVLDTRVGKKSDYIHANYIEGVNRKKEYIAAQGPKPNTLGDFWRMIWQEHVTTIVMLTNLKEGNKIKCHKYWPDKVKPTNIGTVLVKLCEEKEYAFYTTRQLSMYNKELKSTRAVTQYHYTAWPDHGVPEPLCLLTFFNHVMSTQVHNSQGPTTVHCSAGVGRTGTYIALDALYQIGKKRRKVNVAEFVTKMRQNRVSMVQTYEQYITIFLALNEIFKAPIQVDSMAEFSSKANRAGKNIPANQNTVRKEFQLLKKIRPNYTKGDYKFAFNALEGKQADKIMSVDKYSLHLSTGIPKRGSYINAITVPSFTNSQGFIVTKYPPPEDAVDLLRLLNDHESDTVISLQPLRQIESCNTWFPAVSSSLNIQPYTVHHQSKSHSDVTSHVIQIIKDDDEEHNVMVVEPDAEIHCSGSSSGDTSHIRSLVSTVLNLETKKPITILSSDGASLCGVFIAVHNVIQQMKMDDRVDVFTAVRQLQIRRPEFCARFEEYEMIYRALLDYNESASENIYYNQ